MTIRNSGESPPLPKEQKHHHHGVFPASRAGHLDSQLRRLIYRPDRLAERYVKPGNQVLDFGCGPGFFTREFAKRVGSTGKVIAVDLQEEMLQILKKKIEPEGLVPRIRAHQCAEDSIGLSSELDGEINVAFAIFVVHEVPDAKKLFQEISALLAPGGLFFYSEPPFLVPRNKFRDNLVLAQQAGFRLVETRWYFLNRAALLKKI